MSMRKTLYSQTQILILLIGSTSEECLSFLAWFNDFPVDPHCLLSQRNHFILLGN